MWLHKTLYTYCGKALKKKEREREKVLNKVIYYVEHYFRSQMCVSDLNFALEGRVEWLKFF